MNRYTLNKPKMFRAALPALGLLLLAATGARAQVVSVPIFETAYNSQTGPTTVAPTSFVFDARVFTTKAGDVTTATLTGPAGTTPYTTSSPTLLDDRSADFASQAALNAAFPTGTYTTSYSGGTAGSGTVTTNLTPTALTAFPGSTPAFTAATYGGFQGLNSAQSFTASFNSFVTGSVANESDVFFSVFSATTGAGVFSSGSLPAATTSFTLPANALLPGTAYTAVLDFSNRINSTNANGMGNGLGFDRSTSLAFMTATPVPEASTTVSLGLLLALGTGGVVAARKKKKA